MFSFSAVVIALLLIPTFACTVILQLFFPKNTLKVSESHLLPFGLGLTLLCNLNRIFKFIELLDPPCCFVKEFSEQAFTQNLLHNAGDLVALYVSFLLIPVGIFAAIVGLCYFTWRAQILNPGTNQFCRHVARRVDDLLVNYMGKMTAYSAKKQMILVDVLDANDSLYSGIFYEYFMEDKKFVGIQVSNVIRYSFKSETDRKDQGHTTTGSLPTDPREVVDSNAKYGELPYLLPNQGLMFFPVENIQNLHFWYLSKDQKERIYIKKPDKQIRFAWLLGIKYSLPHLSLDVEGFLFEDDESVNLRHLIKAYNTLGIGRDELLKNIKLVDRKEAE